MQTPEKRVMVVGTTVDYIDYIREKIPGRTVFLTAADIAEKAGRNGTNREDELICPLDDEHQTIKHIKNFLERQKIALCGVTCFDCESLLMAAAVASQWRLPFPSATSILNCRNKYLSKMLWTAENIPCPRAETVRCVNDAIRFMEMVQGAIVLKPLSGSGSEFTFTCETPGEVAAAYQKIICGLHGKTGDKMYCLPGNLVIETVLCEEFIPGDEFSCDVAYNGKQINILRIARKYLSKNKFTGTVQAYEIPAAFPARQERRLTDLLNRAVKALGLSRCIFMVDFIVHAGNACLLELTPRPGGDCLPQLIRHSCGADMLQAAIDFAKGILPSFPPKNQWTHLLGIRFHANRPGLLKTIHVDTKDWGENILELEWTRQAGDRIMLPPADYTSWYLGYGIFSPRQDASINAQLQTIDTIVSAEII